MQALGWVFLPLALLPLLYLCLPKIAWLKSLNSHVIEIFDGASYAIGETAKWGLVLLILATVLSVVGLSIFGVSMTKLDELPIYLHASVIMLGSSATLLAGQHVRVDIFHSRYSLKKRALIDIIGFYALILPVCLILLWMSQSFVSQAWGSFEGSPESDGLRGVWLLKTLVPAFALLVFIQGLAITARAAMCLRGDARPQRPQHISPLYGPHQDSAS